MITSNLKGRLGNQMFQIAAAYSLAYDNNDSCVFPVHINGTKPTLDEQKLYSQTIFSKISYSNDFSWVKNYYNEKSFEYEEIPYSQNTLLDGYFQSENYFSNNRELILSLFSETDFIREKVQKYSKFFNDEYVAVHIRRGDYIRLSDYHNNLYEKTDYYNKSFSQLADKKKVFFSDDLDWCRHNFDKKDCYFIEAENDVVELYVMSNIPNKIISNSTFSWWAAWLSKNEKITLAPKKWFGPLNYNISTKTLFPKRWSIIE